MLQTAPMGFAKGSTHPTLRLLICRHGKSNFCIGLRQIDPTGKSLLIFRNRVKPLLQKYFASRHPNQMHIKNRLVPPGGAYRDRHGRWGWDAVDVRASGAQGNRRAR
jgi:hypothetical protein